MRLTTVAALAALLASAPGRVAAGQGAALGADSAFARARRLVTEGNGAAGRALLDSLVQAMPASDPAFADALWWRATLAESSSAAERDLLRLAIELPATPRAAEALLRLGQLEYARGAREAAVRHLERVVREHPDSPAVGPALQWKGRLLLDAGQAAAGCAALDSARARLDPGDVERRHQLDYLADACTVRVPSPQPPAPVVAGGKASPTQAPAPAGPLVRVAAGTLPTRARAESLLRRVEAAGYEGRIAVVGAKKFRVFVGDAVPMPAGKALVAALASKRIPGAVLLPEPPAAGRR